jgi:transposase
MFYVGLDVHQRFSVMCILDENGKLVNRKTVRGHRSKVVDELRKLPGSVAVCYEASCGYGWLHDCLRRVATRVVVAHPGQLRLIFRSKKKNDRADAEKLAKLLFLDEVPTVHVPSVDVRSWRTLIEFRHRLIRKRTRVKNALRALLRGHGVDAPAGQRLWAAKGRSWLATLDFPTSGASLQRDLLLDELTTYGTQIARVERELNTIARDHAGVHLLRTIPGVGPRTAEAMVAYIDDGKRFRRNKGIGSYFGLVPCQDQSAGHNRLGHITRQGPATVRRLLTEAAWQGVRRSAEIRAYFERVQRSDPGRKKIALVATAHYLARVMLAMLQTGECWRFDTPQKEAA